MQQKCQAATSRFLFRLCPVIFSDRTKSTKVSVSTKTKYDAYGLIDEQKLAYEAVSDRNVDRSVIDRLIDHPIVFAIGILGVVGLPFVGFFYLLFGVSGHAFQ